MVFAEVRTDITPKTSWVASIAVGTGISGWCWVGHGRYGTVVVRIVFNLTTYLVITKRKNWDELVR